MAVRVYFSAVSLQAEVADVGLISRAYECMVGDESAAFAELLHGSFDCGESPSFVDVEQSEDSSLLVWGKWLH